MAAILHWLEPDSYRSYTDEERKLVEAREQVLVWAEVGDDSLSYEFDDLALVELDGAFYLLQAAGCSCPSASEVWQITFGPEPDPSVILRGVLDGNYRGYTIPNWAMGELLRGLSVAIASRV